MWFLMHRLGVSSSNKKDKIHIYIYLPFCFLICFLSPERTEDMQFTGQRYYQCCSRQKKQFQSIWIHTSTSVKNKMNVLYGNKTKPIKQTSYTAHCLVIKKKYPVLETEQKCSCRVANMQYKIGTSTIGTSVAYFKRVPE